MRKMLLLVCLLAFWSKGHFKTIRRNSQQAYDDIFVDQVKLLQSRAVDYDQWHPAVKVLHRLIEDNPAIQYNWEYGLSICKATIGNRTGHDVLALINAALNTPPAYFESPIVGLPIFTLFIQFVTTEFGRNFFSQREVNLIIKEILDQYNRMIQSSMSVTFLNEQQPYGWFSSAAKKRIDYSEFDCDPSAKNYGFKNWNEWFVRKFKDIRVTRPLYAGAPEEVDPEDVIVSGCESIPLDFPIQPVANVSASDQFWLKETPYSFASIFGSHGRKKGYPQLFEGGTVYQASLRSTSYHRWHSPVKGIVKDIYKLPGTYFLNESGTNKGSDHDVSEALLSSVATRKIVVIESSNPKIGTIAVVYIGMVEVSSCVATVSIGYRVKKGEQIGHFAFGGSSHAIIFQKQANLKFSDDLYEVIGGKIAGKRQKLRSYLAHAGIQGS